jgi:N-glycosylase/DNA lyase
MDKQRIQLPWFDLEATLESGQCFRWRPVAEGKYKGWVGDQPVEITQKSDCVEVLCWKEASVEVIRHYFDADRDYQSLIAAWENSQDLSHIVAKWKGIRILNQPLQETIVSFILSQNSNIPRIKAMIERFCVRYGTERVMIDGESGFVFPRDWTGLLVTEEDLREMKFGYRAKYLPQVVKAFQEQAYGDEDFESLSRADQKKRLLALAGVGPKVAACIQLFALGDFAAFPMDVWVLRIMRDRYLTPEAKPKEIEAFAKRYFGQTRGYMQQLLFHEYRMRERKNEGSTRG